MVNVIHQWRKFNKLDFAKSLKSMVAEFCNRLKKTKIRGV